MTNNQTPIVPQEQVDKFAKITECPKCGSSNILSSFMIGSKHSMDVGISPYSYVIFCNNKDFHGQIFIIDSVDLTN